MEERPPTIILGLDGAHFELIEPWIEKGKLPNIRKAIESGVSGDLLSVLPPVTSPNWKSYLTGKNPGKLGIYWWENVDINNRRVYYPEHRKNRETEFWEIIAENEQTGVMGVPTTHPPKNAGEFVVSGAPDAANEGFTSPESLEQRLVDEYDYHPIVESELRATPDQAAEDILEAIDAKFEAAADLYEESDLDLLQVTTFYINSLHHYFWDDEYTLRGWKIIDRHLGTYLNEGYDVILMSDHGSTEIETVFHINTWLEKEGYLELDADAAQFAHRLGINRDRVLRLLSPLGLLGFAKKHAPQAIKNIVPDEQGELSRESKTANIDWNTTKVIASGQGPVYLNIDRDSEQYSQIRDQLMNALVELRDENGARVISDVHKGETIYAGEYADEAPDIVVEQAPGVHIQGGIGREKVFTSTDEDGWEGENKREGLFVATGPSFRQGSISDLSILDLAPTVLHLRGHEIPQDMDGEVRSDIFDSKSRAAKSNPAYRDESTKEREKKRIRQAIRSSRL